MNTYNFTISASRLKTYLMCPFAYFLSYELSIKREDSFSTIFGTMLHEVFEKIALGKRDAWRDELYSLLKEYKPWEYHKEYVTGSKKYKNHIDVLNAINSHDGPVEELFVNDKKSPAYCIKEAYTLVEDVLSRKITPFDHKIIAAEKPFRIKIGNGITITGIIDLVLEISDNVIEIYDWKTGNYIPSYDDVMKDPQLKIYDLAAYELFPDKKTRILTLDYIKGKQYTFTISKKEREENRAWLTSKVMEIANDINPSRISETPHRFWKCKYMCSPDDCKTYWPVRKEVIAHTINENKKKKGKK